MHDTPASLTPASTYLEQHETRCRKALQEADEHIASLGRLLTESHAERRRLIEELASLERARRLVRAEALSDDEAAADRA